MSQGNDTHVRYKAVADFASLTRTVRKLRKEINDLRKDEAKLNTESAAGSAASSSARVRHAKAVENDTKSVALNESVMAKAAATTLRQAAATRSSATAHKQNAEAAGSAATATSKLEDGTRRAALALERAAKGGERLEAGTRKASLALDKSARSMRDNAREGERLGVSLGQSVSGAEKLQRGFQTLGNWRPRLALPFVVLIPVLTSILGLVNPLVAVLGAAGAAGLGFASSLGSIAGSAIGIVPALAALISVVGALKVAFGGIGNVFKARSAMKKASDKSSAAPQLATISAAEEVQRAQENYRRSIEDVKFAEEDLDATRAEAIKRLHDLKKAVDQAAMSEAKARANAQLAKENYANVLADPSSTKGQKMEAKVALDEANANVSDVIQQNKDNAAALKKAQQDGIEGDRQVIMAKRRVVDAINAERDSQIKLQNAGKDTAASANAMTTATRLYQEALDKLSPSAKSVVLQLIGMADQWDRLRRSVQEAFFSKIVSSVGLLNRLFPPMTALLDKAAGAAGRVTKRLLEMVSSKKWIRDLGIISDNNVPLIENVGDGLLYILDGLKEIAVAAAPFAIALSEGFKKGADSFRDMVASARESGSLADWLDTVLGRMRQWWRIVKNVGMALFNYSAATANFGKWLTDGFESVTAGWKKSSEAARKEGSPFQKYLEDIKPLLSEVKRLFSTFFGWFSKEATDKNNIKAMTDIVKTIRDDLGPAIGRIMDKLSKAGVGESLISALSSLADVISLILENGGAESIKKFWEAVAGFLDMAKGFFSTPGIGGLIAGFMTFIAGLSALSFIGKFSGLNMLFGWLVRLAKTKGVAGILEKLGSLTGLSALSVTGSGKHSVGTPIAGTRKAALATEKTTTGGGFLGSIGKAGKSASKGAVKGLGVLSTLGKTTGTAAKSAGRGFSLLGSLGKNAVKGVGKGGLLGLVAGVTVGVAADAVRNRAGGSAGNKNSGARVGANIAQGAAQGAGIGALVGNVIPIPGVGAGVGAAVGGAIGAGVGLFSSPAKDRDRFFEDTKGMFSDFFTNLPDQIASWAGNIWSGIQGVGEWLGTVWQGFLDWLGKLPYNIGVAAGFIWGQMQNLGDWLAARWTEFVLWLQDLPQNIANTAGDVWSWMQGVGGWLAARWVEFTKWLRYLPGHIRDAAGDIWHSMQGLGAWLGNVWRGFVGWLHDLPTNIKNTAGDIWRRLGDITGWLGTQGDKILKWAQGIPGMIADGAKSLFGGFSSGANAGYRSARGGAYNGGGVGPRGIRRAYGGIVPGRRSNSDTVDAKLTPGEYVLRKAIVDRIGEDQLDKLNSGVMSYASLLNQYAQSAGGAKEKQLSSGLTSFGSGLTPSFPSTGPTPTPSSFKGFGPGDSGSKPGTSFGNIIINNPVPEPASQSVSRSLRKAAYFGDLGKS